MSAKILKILEDDQWAMAEAEANGDPVIVRFREPLGEVEEVGGYTELLHITWPFASQRRWGPPPKVSPAMELFEERLCYALEQDGHGIVAAVVTTGRFRQWVIYTPDVEECGARINTMPQEDEPYPIDLAADHDPKWNYLRENILSVIEA